MIKKVIYIFKALFLVSCGNSTIPGVSTGTPTQASASREIASPTLSMQSILSQADKGKYKEGELLVKFKSGVAAQSILSIHKAVGGYELKGFKGIPNLEHVKLPSGLSVKDAIVKYMADPNVQYAEPNYYRRAASTIPNDPYFNPQQWALNNTGTFANGTLGADIKMPMAWDITTGNAGIIIAVLDSGIDYSHPDLVNNIWLNTAETCTDDGIDHDGDGYADDCRGWNFVDKDNDPNDDLGHGTHVAGIMGAVGNNGLGISGVMWNVQLMDLKILDSTGAGTVDNEIAAIQYAILKNAKIINASFGGSSFSAAESDAISAAGTAGILFVAAAGNGLDDNGIANNNDVNPEYPATYYLPNIISVAATDQNDQRTSFSNFGANSVHVGAPGNYILSTITPNLTFSLCTGSILVGYDICSGTSMAAPHVSGLAGLLYSYYSNFTSSQVRATILRYVDPLPDLAGWVQTGGRINAYKALSSLLTPTNLTATATSSSAISLTWTDNATGEDGYNVERSVSGGSYAQIATLGPNATAYTDSGLTPSTTYSYQVSAFNTIPANSSFSNAASTATPAGSAGTSSSGGGGGCSIGARQNASTAVADLAVLLLIPFVFMAIMRRKR